jgi:hypothetical protein
MMASNGAFAKTAAAGFAVDDRRAALNNPSTRPDPPTD